jgi:DNA-binding transcriptional LysR family regulator
MNLQRLEGFYWVARHQGYARAARSFPYPITQPGVHQQVRRLEDELGVKLFERVGKDKVVLTPQGQLLFEGFAPFYEQLASLEARVKGGQVGGTLKICAAGHLLRHLMPEWLRRLQGRRPDIAVGLTELPHADVGLLRRGEADLLIDWLPEVPPDVEVREVARTEAWVVAPTHGPHAQKGKLSLAALASMPFIGYHADKQLKALQLAALEAHGVKPREAFGADSSDTIIGFVAAGLGFSLVPALSASGPKAPGMIAQKLERPFAHFPIFAAWRRSPVPHPLVIAALECAPTP